MKFLGSVLETVAIAAIAVVAVALCRQYVFNPYAIAGASMAPSFNDGDYVFVDELIYRLREPLRGEVIVFHSPSIQGEDLVKRIVGLPGGEGSGPGRPGYRLQFGAPPGARSE